MNTHTLESRSVKPRPGEKVITLAFQLQKLDSFFATFSRNPQIRIFLAENRLVIYEELSHRLSNGSKKELFGSFEPLLENAINYLLRFQTEKDNFGMKQEDGLQKIAQKFKKIYRYKQEVETILAVIDEHGTQWIPKEFKKTLNFSFLALPLMFVVYGSMRVYVIAALAESNIEEFTHFILGLYVVAAAVSFIQEQKTLQCADAIVFNPYSNLFALSLSPLLSGVASRTPRYVFELSLIMSAIATQTEASVAMLPPVLATVVAAIIWSGADIFFNLIQQKVAERKINTCV